MSATRLGFTLSPLYRVLMLFRTEFRNLDYKIGVIAAAATSSSVRVPPLLHLSLAISYRKPSRLRRTQSFTPLFSSAEPEILLIELPRAFRLCISCWAFISSGLFPCWLWRLLLPAIKLLCPRSSHDSGI